VWDQRGRKKSFYIFFFFFSSYLSSSSSSSSSTFSLSRLRSRPTFKQAHLSEFVTFNGFREGMRFIMHFRK
jgi:hypothetical protein